MSSKIDGLLGRMTLQEKIGQMLCYGFCGTYPHRDILEVIERYHVAGFRVTPAARKFARYFGPDHPGSRRVHRSPERLERVSQLPGGGVHVSASEYAAVLARLQEKAMSSGAGVPLYFSLDYEGNQSADFFSPGMQGYPHPMGLAASGDLDLTREVAAAVGAQLRAVGIHWVHSPVLDVNTTPENPEIGTRSFGPDAEMVGRYALATLEGYESSGLVATGKHFPGRGHSAEDAHFGVPVIQESPERMREVHLAPYRKLIEDGMPAIMLAHSVYPALDADEEIATLSRPIVTGVLREEMGFDGVIITDSFTMGGLVARYEVAEAAVRTIAAGVDVILLKDENALRGEVFEALLEAVRSGRIPERQVDASVQRMLKVKESYGILSDDRVMSGDKLESFLRQEQFAALAGRAAEKSVVLLRDRGDQLPLKAGQRVLVVEEAASKMTMTNDSRCHVGSLYEALVERGVDAIAVDYLASKIDDHFSLIAERAQEADMVVYTGYYNRGHGIVRAPFERFFELGKPLVFVTNSPYPEVVSPGMDAVVVTFGVMAASMQAAADVLTGRRQAEARLGFDPEKMY